MRLLFPNTTHPSRVAKSLRKALLTLGQDIPLRRCQEWTARLFGYADWHEMVQVSRPGQASPWDDQIPVEEAVRRHRRFVGALVQVGLTEAVAEQAVARVRPAARSSRAPTPMRSWRERLATGADRDTGFFVADLPDPARWADAADPTPFGPGQLLLAMSPGPKVKDCVTRDFTALLVMPDGTLGAALELGMVTSGSFHRRTQDAFRRAPSDHARAIAAITCPYTEAYGVSGAASIFFVRGWHRSLSRTAPGLGMDMLEEVARRLLWQAEEAPVFCIDPAPAQFQDLPGDKVRAYREHQEARAHLLAHVEREWARRGLDGICPLRGYVAYAPQGRQTEREFYDGLADPEDVGILEAMPDGYSPVSLGLGGVFAPHPDLWAHLPEDLVSIRITFERPSVSGNRAGRVRPDRLTLDFANGTRIATDATSSVHFRHELMAPGGIYRGPNPYTDKIGAFEFGHLLDRNLSLLIREPDVVAHVPVASALLERGSPAPVAMEPFPAGSLPKGCLSTIAAGFDGRADGMLRAMAGIVHEVLEAKRADGQRTMREMFGDAGGVECAKRLNEVLAAAFAGAMTEAGAIHGLRSEDLDGHPEVFALFSACRAQAIRSVADLRASDFVAEAGVAAPAP